METNVEKPTMDTVPTAKTTRCRIALSGGPGGGKTTAADLFRRELGEHAVIVPESATILFSGGFPRSNQPEAQIALQKAIFNVQRNLEDVQSARYPDRILLCDRGTIDGGAYWPGGPDEFFATMGTTLQDELLRYDAVVFFETAAVSGTSIEGGNPSRIETLNEALILDKKLHKLWSCHPHFLFVPNMQSFIQKVVVGMSLLSSVVAQLNRENETRVEDGV